MTEYVIDTNIVFSIIRNPDSRLSEAFFSAEDNRVTFSAPEYLQIELDRHRGKLRAKSKLEERDLDRLMALIYRRIRFFKDSMVPLDSYIEASRLIRDVDPLDVPFVALSIYLEIPLFTGDRKLFRGLLNRGYTLVVEFDDLKQKHNL